MYTNSVNFGLKRTPYIGTLASICYSGTWISGVRTQLRLVGPHCQPWLSSRPLRNKSRDGAFGCIRRCRLSVSAKKFKDETMLASVTLSNSGAAPDLQSASVEGSSVQGLGCNQGSALARRGARLFKVRDKVVRCPESAQPTRSIKNGKGHCQAPSFWTQKCT